MEQSLRVNKNQIVAQNSFSYSNEFFCVFYRVFTFLIIILEFSATNIVLFLSLHTKHRKVAADCKENICSLNKATDCKENICSVNKAFAEQCFAKEKSTVCLFFEH